MGCATCGKRRKIETFKVRVKVPAPLDKSKVIYIQRQLEALAKELIDGKV